MSDSTPSFSYRCETCKSRSAHPRNLIIFIDGTSNKPGYDKDTNVCKLSNDIASSTENSSGIEQKARYWKGIGAHYTRHLPLPSWVSKKISSGFEMAFAGNVGENVKEAYDWLVQQYQEGDQIYLFGFSRGAYQVRALASMIHEVGLARTEGMCETAYELYISIDFYKPHTRSSITRFKTESCWQGVRVHFIGVWDTVSSLGLIKKDVHVTASASVTNACHFRHALALDELRVKFLPEYFGEMNAHHSNVRTARLPVSDVKEVWFAGSHSNVGGVDFAPDSTIAYHAEENSGTSAGHTSNVPLEWIRREAAVNGIAFRSLANEASWYPQDVELGRKESMTLGWKFFEVFPIRHQVSFSGTGKHKWRWHLCHPRSVIPSQQIHPSVFSADIYTPRATLGNSARNSVVLRRPSGAVVPLDERARTDLLGALLGDEQATLDNLEQVLFLIDSLNYEATDNGRPLLKPRAEWKLSGFQGRPLAQYALTVISDVTSQGNISDTSLNGARSALCTILQSSPDHPTFTRALYVLRFSAKHSRLRQRFVDDHVSRALMVALEQTAKSPRKILFPLVIDSLCYFIADEKLSRGVINRFHGTPDETESHQTRISLTLDVKVPIHLMASLKIIACLAQHRPDLCNEFKPRLYELAKSARDGVGPAAVKALVTMNAQRVPREVTHDVYICNILGYLDGILPPLDVEVVGSASRDIIDELPTILQINGQLNEDFMRELLSTVQSRNTRERMAATLTLLKLCKNVMVRVSCARNNALDIFVKQLEQKKTSLLAAYALRECLEYNDMRTSDHFRRAAPALVSMIEKNWFDDAIGRVEGCEIFRSLMMSADLREDVLESGIVLALIRMLASGERHQTRMSLICIDILDQKSSLNLEEYVESSVSDLQNQDRDIRMKGVKVISALAQTVAGEQAIKGRLNSILEVLSQESQEGRAPSRSQIVGAPSVLYNLAKNETLRELIRGSQEFADWKARRRSNISDSQRQATLRN